MKRLSFAFIAACGAGTPPTAHIEPIQSLPDAAITDAAPVVVDDAWHGEGCRTIASRTAPIEIDKVAVSGALYDGRTHCYLDLPKPLCFQWASDAGAGTGDAGMEQIEVASLRITGGCGGSYGEAEFRGRLDKPIVPVRRHGWAIEIDSSYVKSVTVAVTIAEIADKPSTLEDLQARFGRCWDNPTASATLTLAFRVAADGSVADVRRQSGSGLATAAEQCVIDAAREAAKFNAGAARTITLPITFTRTLAPMP